mmetsp:Transcript_39577/g.79099  ORF Transcript_39577/g.79099 Transcript_39577/m.79099 type:complete len:131 (-) Transcript_39577:471-863(-)
MHAPIRVPSRRLLLDAPRTDCPMHLPDAPPAADPWDPPPGSAMKAREWRDKLREAGEEVEPEALHCSSVHGAEESKCRDPRAPNLKQKRQVRLLSSLMGKPTPDVEAMTFMEAERSIGEHWKAWMEREEL